MFNFLKRENKSGRIPLEFKPALEVHNQPMQGTKSFSYSNAITSVDNLFDIFTQTGFNQITNWQAIRYYNNIAPIANACDIISQEVASIQLKYQEGNEFKDHKVLELLRHPNADSTFKEFMFNYASFYKITGNSFILATGRINEPPLELINIPPQFVSIQNDERDGFPRKMTAGFGKGKPQETFERIEQNGRFRFVNESRTRELWHVKNFNAEAQTNFGTPQLMPLYYEIEQYLHSSKHNLSLLQKGGRLTGALIADGALTDEQYQRAQEQINQYFSGADNAGRILIGEGNMKYEEMGINNRDMDFRNLKKDDAITIYNRMRIPLPIVSPDHMAKANYEEARLALYDNAVLPDANRLYEELTMFLAPRYQWKNLDETKLTFDIDTIPALQLRRNQEIKMRKEIGANTIDEIREKLGDKPIDINGQYIYLPANMAPVNLEGMEERFLGDSDFGVNPDGDVDDDTEAQNDNKELKRLGELLKAQVDEKDERVFTDEDITRILVKERARLNCKRATR